MSASILLECVAVLCAPLCALIRELGKGAAFSRTEKSISRDLPESLTFVSGSGMNSSAFDAARLEAVPFQSELRRPLRITEETACVRGAGGEGLKLRGVWWLRFNQNQTQGPSTSHRASHDASLGMTVHFEFSNELGMEVLETQGPSTSHRASHDATLGMTVHFGFSNELGMEVLETQGPLSSCRASHDASLGMTVHFEFMQMGSGGKFIGTREIGSDDNVMEIEAELPWVELILWSSY